MHIRKPLALLTLPLAFGLVACDMTAEELGNDPGWDEAAPKAFGPGCSSGQGTSVPAGLSPHFQGFLDDNYPEMDFMRADLAGGSFGGFASSTDCAARQPVIFVHGNSDRALGGTLGGWEDSVSYFRSRGYRRAELYGTTYGPGSASSASSYYHSRENLTQIRLFIEAVLDYTGADKVDVIGHSMGVTISRKAIKGGWANDLADGGDYFLGAALTSRVDTFVGIAGGNLGLTTCYFTPGVPTCGATNGFYPGALVGFFVVGMSNILQDINASLRYEGAFRYSIWSTVDEIVGGACLVWGRNTCRVPGHTGEKVYSSYPFGHIGVRDQTPAVQYSMVVNHVVP
jgi:pimeloyl-ACP methyl ester carboxylesterase